MTDAYLPNEDPNPEQRKQALAKQKQAYQYEYDAIPGVILVQDLPPQENFSMTYLLKRDAEYVKLLANMFASRVENLVEPFDQLKDYEELFPLLPKPSVIKNFRYDSSFARQRIAGANPMVIKGINKLPPNFSLTNEIFQKVMGKDKTLESEGALGRLYLADYAVLQDITLGRYEQGFKFITAPLVLYCWQPSGYSDRGKLVPVAIQLGQTPPPDNLIYTPLDELKWLAAKIFAQIADANHHELITHLGRTHLVAETFALATATELAPNHPINLLLKPHFQFTLAINLLAEKQLLNPGGSVDQLLAGTLNSSLKIASKGTREYLENFSDFAFPKELANRRVNDANLLPDYPFRDDGLLLWQAIEQYVRDYLSLYYTKSTAIINDPELQNWASKLMSPKGGNVKKLFDGSRLETLNQLVAIITQVIFVAGPQHAAVNYTQYDYMTYAPNMPLAGYRPPTDIKNSVDEAFIMKLLPPQQQASLQLSVLYSLTSFQFNRLGYPDSCAFTDPRVNNEVIPKFQRRLQEIEIEINRRNEKRLEPYLFLKPSRVPNSINI